MQRNKSLVAKWALLIALVIMALPVTAFAQRRWVVVRQPRQTRVVIYQPRPSDIYRQSYSSPYYTYGYTEPYYGTRYNNTYTYAEPGYGTTYYSYRYSQPYYANRYTYSSANPTYRRTYREYRPPQRSGVRFGIYIR